MAIHVIRLGSPRGKNEGVRLGTVRRPPRGLPKTDIARRDFYDVWLPELAPSLELFAWVRAAPVTDQRWRQFVRRYLAEMSRPDAKHLIATLAALSHDANFAVGCYCEDANRCHRSLLEKLLADAGADIADRAR